MEVISLVNQKGGVAKTTSCINIGSCLAELGKKVLLVDCDPQGNLTTGLGIEDYDKTIYDCLLEELPISEAICSTGLEKLDIVPADIKLANAEIELASVFGRETVLKDSFEKSNLDYDYVLIDCNPSLGLLTINALAASNGTIIPFEPSIFALDGIEQLVKVITLVQKKINPKLTIKGALLTRVDARTGLAKEIKAELKEVFEEKMFDTVIHQNIQLTKAQIKQKPINIYDPKAKGAIEYMKVAKELIERD